MPDNKCHRCKITKAVVTTNNFKIMWCANCYTQYLTASLIKEKTRYVQNT